MRKPWTSQSIAGLAQAYWSSCALHAAVRTGLIARLAKGPATLQELIGELKLSRRGLDALLIALSALGLLCKKDDRYSLAPDASPFLTPGSTRDMSNAVLHMADMVSAWAELADCVRTGEPVERVRIPGTVQTPEREHFYRAMRDLARQQVVGLASRLGLEPGQHLLDMGGGPGVYALTFAREVPGLQVTIFDLPGAKPYFLEEAAGRSEAERVEFREGDYHQDDVGGPYEVVWLSHVLHGEGPEECRRLVEKAARVLAPGGVLWIQEFVVEPEGEGHPFAALFSLNMLVNTKAGKSYSKRELAEFMVRAGLEGVDYLGPTKEDSPAALMRGFKST